MVSTILSKINYLDSSEVDGFLNSLVATKGAISLGFLNQHGFNLMIQEENVYDNFLSLDYLLRDGIGIELACKIKGLEAKANLNGTDLIPKIVQRALSSNRSCKFFVYGTEEPWLTTGSEKLFEGNEVKVIDGFQPLDYYLEHYSDYHDEGALNLVLLAMGMPKQEKVAQFLKNVSKGPLLVICGGAIIDFQAGKTERAPENWRKFNMEWLFRLIKEPKRMFKRYVIGIPSFFYYLLIK